MNTDAALIFAVLLACILFIGEPDLLDALISRLTAPECPLDSGTKGGVIPK